MFHSIQFLLMCRNIHSHLWTYLLLETKKSKMDHIPLKRVSFQIVKESWVKTATEKVAWSWFGLSHLIRVHCFLKIFFNSYLKQFLFFFLYTFPPFCLHFCFFNLFLRDVYSLISHKVLYLLGYIFSNFNLNFDESLKQP